MIEPPERSVGEVESMVPDVTGGGGGGAPEGAVEKGREFIKKMRDAGNDVLQNPYGEPIIEIIAPRGMEDDVEEHIDEWDMNPSGHSVIAQAPSFEEDRPEVAEGLSAWQFLMDDDEGEDLMSCGYDMEQIMSGLDDDGILWLCTKAPRVRTSLPVE